MIGSLLLLFFVYRGAKTGKDDDEEKDKTTLAPLKSKTSPTFGLVNETIETEVKEVPQDETI